MKKIAVMLGAVAVAVAALFVPSCKKADKELTPEQVVTKAWNAYIAKDYETFVSYLDWNDEQKAATVELLKEKEGSEGVNSLVEFSIRGSEIDGDTAHVSLWGKYSDGSISEQTQDLHHTADGWKIGAAK